jgi:DNA-binding HxlR family transcriptional regulator
MNSLDKNLSNRVLKKSLSLLNNKFKLEILYHLNIRRKMRFGEIKNNIATITQQLLTKLLREMEKDTLITREVSKGFPRRVDYSLTKFGKSTKPIINSIFRWELNNSTLINKVVKKNVLDSIYDYY